VIRFLLVLAETEASAHNSQKTSTHTILIQPVVHHLRKTIYITLIFILILYSSCKKDKDESEKNAIEQTKINQEDRFYFDCKKQIINEIEFEACIKRPGNFTIKNSERKIIYSHKDNPFDFEFSGFNGDEFPDIKMNYASNTPGLQELLLFDIKTNEFREVKSFNKYPNSKRINDSDFYYSYHGSGCADNDWGSELYKIVENEITELGKIQGLGCLENDKNGIYIYKVNGSKKQLLKYTKREQGYWKEKWDYIEKYWTENKTKFE